MSSFQEGLFLSGDLLTIQIRAKDCYSDRFLAGILVLEGRKTGIPIGALGEDGSFSAISALSLDFLDLEKN